MPHRAPLVREVLQTFLADYLRLVEPDSAQHLELDQITFPAVPDWSPAEHQRLGVVGEAPSRWGEQVTLLIQVEPEALTPAELSRRIGCYFMDLEIHYCQPVLLHVLYLQGGRPGINLETAPICRIFNMDLLRLYFTAFGIGGCRAEYYLERPEPVAWALAALMPALRLSRAQHRACCLERVAGCPLQEEQKALLRSCIDAFLA